MAPDHFPLDAEPARDILLLASSFYSSVFCGYSSKNIYLTLKMLKVWFRGKPIGPYSLK